MKIITVVAFCFLSFAAFAADIAVYAAASTSNAVNEILAEFERETGIEGVASYASSGTLAKQIDNGAPADVFISANVKWMSWLKKRGIIFESKLLFSNRLVLIVNREGAIFNLGSAVASGGRIAIADPAHSPAGRYSKAVFENSGLLEEVRPKLTRMQTVRAALALVERNVVPFGVVYKSDASLSDKVKVAEIIDSSLHDKIVYPCAVVNSSKQVNLFYDYLSSKKAHEIFEKYGFLRVD